MGIGPGLKFHSWGQCVTHLTRWIGAAFGVLLALACSGHHASAGIRLGSEFQVNTFTTNDQVIPVVAKLASGGFVVVWESNREDGSGTGVYGQLYDATGVRVGSEFQVNTYTLLNQSYPTVVGLSGGGFVVIWGSQRLHGTSAYDAGFGQLYDAAGVRVGTEFHVTPPSSTKNFGVSVPAALRNGGFVVLWEASNNNHQFWANIYDATGTLLRPSFKIVSGFYPRVAGLTDSGFVLIWSSCNSTCTAYGQRYTLNGKAIGPPFVALNSNCYVPEVTGSRDGGFILVWESCDQGIYGQRYSSSAAPIGVAFRINSFTAGTQADPVVAELRGGGFVVTWDSKDQDGQGWGVYTQRYDRTGARLGGEFRVNTSTSGDQLFPSTTGLSGGGFVTVWNSYDADGWGVFGQVFK
jgi:hypothetical protein